MGLAVATIGVAVLVAHAPPPLRSTPGPGIVRWHAAGTEVVALGGGGWRASPGTEATLEELRRAGVGSIDALVVVDDSVSAAVVEAVTARHRTGVVLAPATAEVVGTAVPADGTDLQVGHLHVTIVPGEQRLVVEARPREGPR